MRIFPSDVVALIDELFPWVSTDGQPPAGGQHQINPSTRPQLASIGGALKHIPEECIILQGRDLIEFITAVDDLDSTLREINQSELRSRLPNFAKSTALGGRHPLAVIRISLAKCPDQVPVAASQSLLFIKDPVLRDGLRLDISGVHDAIAGANWKAATVLGGAVVEALLLWALESFNWKATSPAKRGPDILWWDLSDLIESSLELGVISENTVAQANLSRDARNLIHPGKMLRDRAECHRGTAFAAAAAIDYVIKDLERV